MRNTNNRSRAIFGKIIHNKRKEMHLTLQNVAERCDVSTNFISMVERGIKTPNDEVVIKIAKTLKLNEHELFLALDKIHPLIHNNILKAMRHTKIKELLDDFSSKVIDDNLREHLYEEVYNVYLDFLKRNKLDNQ